MRVFSRYPSALIAVSLAIATSSAIAEASSIVFSAAGSGPASIQANVDSFRAAIGNPNNGNLPGELPGGRREINWDGGGATGITTTGTPLTAFENTRGALITTPGTGFTQSPISSPGLDSVFGNPTYTVLFEFFSPIRVFTPIGSNITDVTFSIPGTNGAVPATVSAFGAVFSDVDLPTSTSIQYFGLQGNSLGTFFAPNVAGANASLSFLGVLFDAGEEISRVRLTTGNAALSSTAVDTANTDLVIMDDFIYSEPASVPEPSALLLIGCGLAALGLGVARMLKR